MGAKATSHLLIGPDGLHSGHERVLGCSRAPAYSVAPTSKPKPARAEAGAEPANLWHPAQWRPRSGSARERDGYNNLTRVEHQHDGFSRRKMYPTKRDGLDGRRRGGGAGDGSRRGHRARQNGGGGVQRAASEPRCADPSLATPSTTRTAHDRCRAGTTSVPRRGSGRA